MTKLPQNSVRSRFSVEARDIPTRLTYPEARLAIVRRHYEEKKTFLQALHGNYFLFHSSCF
jgi:hypothetical protein